MTALDWKAMFEMLAGAFALGVFIGVGLAFWYVNRGQS
jgi:hypothetical protein